MFCLEAAAGLCSVAFVERDVVTDGLLCILKVIFNVFPRIFGLVVNDYINWFHI